MPWKWVVSKGFFGVVAVGKAFAADQPASRCRPADSHPPVSSRPLGVDQKHGGSAPDGATKPHWGLLAPRSANRMSVVGLLPARLFGYLRKHDRLRRCGIVIAAWMR